jgi:pimeloyl-ACP methyl ester carboxylesterase
MKFKPWKFLAASFVMVLLMPFSALSHAERVSDSVSLEVALSRIRVHIEALLAIEQPELFKRHLRSVLALAEEDVMKLEFDGMGNEAQATEMLGYLNTIEMGLKGDGDKAGTYLVEGKRPLVLARLSKSDGTLQFFTLLLPPHWDPRKPYPLYIHLHGRGPDTPLAIVGSTFQTPVEGAHRNADFITVVPWLRGNGEWRNENGSEPDIWEAIEDVKSFASVDVNRWYLAGHSWGGDDAWSIVQRTPDLWAAVGIMAGNPVGAPAELGLLSNAKHVPFYLWIGENDKERIPSFNSFRSSLIAVDDPPNVVVAARTEHNYRHEDAAAMENWLLQHTRRMPDHFSFIVDTPQHRGIWGISIPRIFPDAYPQAEPRVKFECWIEGNVIRIRTWDAKKIEVDFGPIGLNLSGNVKLIVNRKTMFSGVAPTKPLLIDL